MTVGSGTSARSAAGIGKNPAPSGVRAGRTNGTTTGRSDAGGAVPRGPPTSTNGRALSSDGKSSGAGGTISTGGGSGSGSAMRMMSFGPAGAAGGLLPRFVNESKVRPMSCAPSVVTRRQPTRSPLRLPPMTAHGADSLPGTWAMSSPYT